ncbi:MAG: transcriptional regulator [Gammaproteobacteria bacterium]
MKRLEHKKLLTIITARELEKMLITAMTQRGIGGYTVVQASGAGASGIQSGMLEGDTNILIYVILSEPRLVTVLDDLEVLMARGHRLKAIVSDISILPRK